MMRERKPVSKLRCCHQVDRRKLVFRSWGDREVTPYDFPRSRCNGVGTAVVIHGVGILIITNVPDRIAPQRAHDLRKSDSTG